MILASKSRLPSANTIGALGCGAAGVGLESENASGAEVGRGEGASDKAGAVVDELKDVAVGGTLLSVASETPPGNVRQPSYVQPFAKV